MTTAINTRFEIGEDEIIRLQNAVKAKENIQGFTHTYYKYPARFSPKFVREVIDIFSKPGDVILDPFVGGGTTLVESLACNRHSIGFDVSPIASFVSQAKTTILTQSDFNVILLWAESALAKRIVDYAPTKTFYDDDGYLNNLPWRIRLSVELILDDIELLKITRQKRFAKCVLLKTAQWAIDCRKRNPTTKDFKQKFTQNLNVCFKGARELAVTIEKHSPINKHPYCISVNESSESINKCEAFKTLPSKPKLVITSPPYVGVHMLYHQWQVNGRKRTRAPFWIINSLDGQGSSFYTFGHYQSHAKKTYFDIAKNVFSAIHSAIDDQGIVVQLVGFSNAKKFLPKYLEMMAEAGYEEVPLITDKLNRIKRIWRDVPNRKWYFRTQDKAPSSKEVLLIHVKK